MGTTEIVFILTVYLLVFGTKGLPSMARQMGRVMRQARDATQDIQREILSGTENIRKEAQSMRKEVQKAGETRKSGSEKKPGE
jgi:TatA/E family protein of Tat protein translocase